MTTLLKETLQEHYNLFFPAAFVKELKSLGAKDLNSSVEVIKKNYIKKVYKYILNDYKLVDEHGIVRVDGSILLVDQHNVPYSNNVSKPFKDYVSSGMIDALFKAFKSELNQNIEIVHYGSAAVGTVNSGAKVVTIMGLIDNDSGIVYWGVGDSTNALLSAVDSFLSVINRMEMLKDQTNINSSKKTLKTADELSKEMLERARKILAGEEVESKAKKLNSY